MRPQAAPPTAAAPASVASARASEVSWFVLSASTEPSASVLSASVSVHAANDSLYRRRAPSDYSNINPFQTMRSHAAAPTAALPE